MEMKIEKMFPLPNDRHPDSSVSMAHIRFVDMPIERRKRFKPDQWLVQKKRRKYHAFFEIMMDVIAYVGSN